MIHNVLTHDRGVSGFFATIFFFSHTVSASLSNNIQPQEILESCFFGHVEKQLD